MAILIGRKKEQEILKRLYDSKEAELVVVYGRRRVGKTFLVNQTFSNQFTFKVTGLHQVRLADQLSNFMMALREYSHDNQSRKVKSWMEAFDMLKTYLISIKTTGKKVIFFDELPWMDTPNSKFLSAFEWFWNGWGNTQDNLLMVVCGSATNWIINKLFKHKGGLYNRADSKLYLRPFTLLETERYLQSRGIYWERYEIAQTYMIMGGIPYYLKQLEPGESLAKNIDQCFFQKNCTLWDEFDSLYETLFGHSEVYLKVVEALAEKKVGLTRDEIVKKTHLPNNGALSDILKNLVKCGFVNAYHFFGKKSKYQTYQLCDFFTLFYFKFIKDNYGRDSQFWTHMIDNPKKQVWQGYTFELLIQEHIEQLKFKLGIGAILTQQSTWFVQKRDIDEPNIDGAQVDLVIDRRDRAINLCEAKFHASLFTIDKDYSLNLRNKIEAFKAATKTRKAILPTMITSFGLKKNPYSNLIQQEATLDDLFSF